MGESPPPAKPEDYRVRTLALDLVNAIQSQPECSRALYVGNSFGGWVTAWAALLHPEKVSKLLLVGSGGMTIPVLSGHLLSRPTRQTLEEFQRRAYYSPRALTEAEWEQALKRASETPSQEILAAQRTEDELRPYLGGLQVPTHVFRGSADQIVPERVAREMASRIPGAVYYEAPQCGHLPQKECPEALWRAIQNLLKSGAL
jgi:pimeloyl-ACP methyl ester carboxylesterase